MPEARERLPIASAPLSVLLLADNEGSDLDAVLGNWVQFLESLQRTYEIIVVDDGSSDGTRQRAEGWTQKCPHLKVLHHPTRMGTGAALRTGLAAARFPLLFYTTCDQQFQPGDFPALLERIDKVDVATGIRNPGPLPWPVEFFDFVKRLLARVFIGLEIEPRVSWLGVPGMGRRFVARWLFGLRHRDPECLFRLFRRDLFRRIPVQSEGLFGHYEVLAKANFLGAWMEEVAIPWKPNPRRQAADEESPFGLEAFLVFCRPDFGPAVLPEVQPG